MEIENRQDIPEKDHIARYCSPAQIKSNGEIYKSGFALRSGETYLSVNWLEHFANEGDMQDKISSVCKDLRKGTLSIKEKGRFAVINVGRAKRKIHDIFIKHIPNSKNPSHAGIVYPDKVNVGKQQALELSKLVKDTFPVTPESS